MYRSRTAFLSRLRSISLISTRLVESLLAGGYRSVFRGQGVEFDEVREYVPGDDIRLIDWNVTSRMANPYTKVFKEERELTLFLLADTSASLYAGSGRTAKDEVILLVFATLALAAVANDDRVGAAFFSDRIQRWVTPSKGHKHVHSLLNGLISAAPTGPGTEMTLALRTANQTLKRRGICVILSDFKCEGYWDELGRLARKHDVIAIRVTDPADYEFPESGLMELRDPETGTTMLAEGHSRRFRDRYHEYAHSRRQKWDSDCHRRGVETLEINTSEDAGQRLYSFFERRRRRR